MQKRKRDITPRNMRALAIQIMDYLNDIGYWNGTSILVDGQIWTSQSSGLTEYKSHTRHNTVYYIETDVDISSRLKYSNPDTINLIFEGELHQKINRDSDFISILSAQFLSPYGLYFEQGHSWSMSAFKI